MDIILDGQGGAGVRGWRVRNWGWRGRNRGWRGREAGVEGREAGIEEAGESGKIGAGNSFFIENSEKNDSFRPRSYIKVHQIKKCIFVWTMFFTRPT